jgi:hypothetical protein
MIFILIFFILVDLMIVYIKIFFLDFLKFQIPFLNFKKIGYMKLELDLFMFTVAGFMV